jgi:hypothetical protein
VFRGQGTKTVDRVLAQRRIFLLRLFRPFFIFVIKGGGEAVLMICDETMGVDMPNGWQK